MQDEASVCINDFAQTAAAHVVVGMRGRGDFGACCARDPGAQSGTKCTQTLDFDAPINRILCTSKTGSERVPHSVYRVISALLGLNSQSITRRVRKTWANAEVAFGGENGFVAERQLNLFEGRAVVFVIIWVLAHFW